MGQIDLVDRAPTVTEYESLVEQVGFSTHDHAAVEIAIRNSIYCACAVHDGEVIGVGRIVGDGAITFLLTSVLVAPGFQRRGVGTAIVTRLCERMDEVPFRNAVLEVLPLSNLGGFYRRCGFEGREDGPPGMVRWYNRE